MTKKIIAIVAMDKNRVIGNEGGIPWHLPEDMKRFSSLTRGQIVLMGRKTFESLPQNFRPLPDRLNLVVTSKPENILKHENIIAIDCPNNAIKKFLNSEIQSKSDTLWVIGGAEIYKSTLNSWNEIYLTLVDGVHEGDTLFPIFEDKFELIEEKMGTGAKYQRYILKN